MLTQESSRPLLQLIRTAFSAYRALAKLSRGSEGICGGGKTRSAPARRYDHIWVCVVTPKWSPSLLQLTGYAFGTYKALGKRASDRKCNGSGGQTKSDPARRYDHIWVCMVTPKRSPSLLQLTGYAFGAYEHLGKRACAREGNGSGGQTKSAPRAPL
jgi:hypothetical protein